MNENSLKNLKSFNKDTAKVCGRKGGIASVEAKRKKKSLRECVQMYGELGCTDTMKEKLRELGVTDESYLNNNMAIIYGLFRSAMRGNVGAVRLILELRGELNQRNMVTVTTNVVSPYDNLTEDELRRLAAGE